MENIKHKLELGDIFRSHGEEFLSGHHLSCEQRKAFHDIVQCRTAALGGHVDQCDHCGYTRPSYNSCRNRHCPKCQFMKKVQWVDKLAANLPPVKQFHIVFTIPQCLHRLFYLNQRLAYTLLFAAAGKALQQCAASRFAGAQIGAVAILHTWGQTLIYHPHIHMIVPSGGLSQDQMEWIYAGKKFFLPVKILSLVFRGILCRLLEEACNNGEIRLPKETLGFNWIKDQCYRKKWVVYCEKPFSSSDNLIQYLGNYTHRVAISNHRLIEHKDNKVQFWYKDYRSCGLRKSITLSADEFIRRFLHHILPSNFYRIRYFGFLAMCNAPTKLATCFDLIEKHTWLSLLEGLNSMEVWRIITGRDPVCCPVCWMGKMRRKMDLPVERVKSG
jgi:hypothetical protein